MRHMKRQFGRLNNPMEILYVVMCHLSARVAQE